jgi:hypothetical protein
MSDAETYAAPARITVERQDALAWLRKRLWWDARLAELEAPPPHPQAADEERGRGAA